MSVPVFVDTNVLVYARDASEPTKQPKAWDWLEALWRSRAGRISSQVLHELYVTTTQKLVPGLSREEARRDIRDLMAWDPLVLDSRLLDAAWSVQDEHSVSFWDALIVAAANRTGCEHLLSEDLQDGYHFGPTSVVNPFTHRPEDVLTR